MAVIGYVRVSDDKQNEAMQIAALQEAGCEKIYGDIGVSGSVIEREGLNAVLEVLCEGDTLVVWKFDRLGRSTVHLLLLFDDLRRRGINFVSTTQGINTATFEGRIFFGQLALFAEYEREMIRERTRAGMKAAKAAGKHIGRPRKLSHEKIEQLKGWLSADSRRTELCAAKRFKVSQRTVARALRC